MILMYSEKGGYMNCYTLDEIARAKSRGWVEVIPHIATKPQEPSKTPKRKARAKK